jgi:hypothetical protein
MAAEKLEESPSLGRIFEVGTNSRLFNVNGDVGYGLAKVRNYVHPYSGIKMGTK